MATMPISLQQHVSNESAVNLPATLRTYAFLSAMARDVKVGIAAVSWPGPVTRPFPGDFIRLIGSRNAFLLPNILLVLSIEEKL